MSATLDILKYNLVYLSVLFRDTIKMNYNILKYNFLIFI